MNYLKALTMLSQAVSGPDYVLGGGGNTSVKDDNTLWIKPSGTVLGALSEKDFVALKRERLSELNAVDETMERQAREREIQRILTAAKCDVPSDRRPSVEAPLHHLIEHRFVAHTHPTLVNGMTCSKNGRETCSELFPDALWIDFVDPGFMLYREARERIGQYRDLHDSFPETIFLKNHGVAISGDSPKRVQDAYRRIFHTLTEQYRKAGIPLTLPAKEGCPASYARELENALRQSVSAPAETIVSDFFEVAPGPLTPDYIVYAGAFAYVGWPDRAGFREFRHRHGSEPRIVAAPSAVAALGDTASKARLALALARDGALAAQLARAFGGVETMSGSARAFIEGWEAEHYRSKLA